MSKKVFTTDNGIFNVDILNKENYTKFDKNKEVIFIITGFSNEGIPNILSYSGKDSMTIIAFSDTNKALDFIRYQSQNYKNFAVSEAGVKAVAVKLDLHFSKASDKNIVLDPPKEIDLKYNPLTKPI